MRFLLTATIVVATVVSMSSTSPPQISSPASYFIDDGKGVPGFESADRELAELAFAAWSRESGGRLKFVRASRATDALLRVHWISAADGLYGETQRTSVNGKPGAIINVSPSVSGLGEPLSTMAAKDRLLRDTIVYLTCVHETGHAIGMQHTRNFEDIMYSFAYGGDFVEYFSRFRRKLKSREDISRFSGMSSGDAAVLKSLY